MSEARVLSIYHVWSIHIDREKYCYSMMQLMIPGHFSLIFLCLCFHGVSCIQSMHFPHKVDTHIMWPETFIRMCFYITDAAWCVAATL